MSTKIVILGVSGLVLLTVAAVLVLPRLAIDVKSVPVAVVPPGRPDYVQFYGLANRPDAGHATKVVQDDNTVWFRENTPGLSLDCCNPGRIHADMSAGGEVRVTLGVRDACREDLLRWSRDRTGEMAGLFINGELVHVARIQSPLRDVVRIPVSGTIADADRLATKILEEGFGERIP